MHTSPHEIFFKIFISRAKCAILGCGRQGDMHTLAIAGHRFKAMDENCTLITEEIMFECRYWIVGKIIEHLILRKLDDTFDYREKRTKEILEARQ